MGESISRAAVIHSTSTKHSFINSGMSDSLIKITATSYNRAASFLVDVTKILEVHAIFLHEAVTYELCRETKYIIAIVGIGYQNPHHMMEFPYSAYVIYFNNKVLKNNDGILGLLRGKNFSHAIM